MGVLPPLPCGPGTADTLKRTRGFSKGETGVLHQDVPVPSTLVTKVREHAYGSPPLSAHHAPGVGRGGNRQGTVLITLLTTGCHQKIREKRSDHSNNVSSDTEGGRETQEGGDMGIYVYI